MKNWRKCWHRRHKCLWRSNGGSTGREAAAVSQDTGVLPEIKLPDDLKEEQKAYELTGRTERTVLLFPSGSGYGRSDQPDFTGNKIQTW